MKNRYLLTQISDILMHVYLACNKLMTVINQSKKYIFTVIGEFSQTTHNR